MTATDLYRYGTPVLALVLLLSACAAQGLVLPTPAPGRPTSATPSPIDLLVTVEGDRVTDSNEITSSCVFLYMWADTAEGQHWQLVAINRTLLDAQGQDAEGKNIFCDTAGHFGPRSYRIPLWKVPAGWYTACASGCSEPFEHRG
ncbi:MAG: hypothetical protein ACE5F5_02755 [Acidimicrobiia bacterium]